MERVELFVVLTGFPVEGVLGKELLEQVKNLFVQKLWQLIKLKLRCQKYMI